MRLFATGWGLSLCLALSSQLVLGQEPITLREALVIRSVGRQSRSPVHTDPIEALLAAGNWHAPTPGETVPSATGTELKWERVTGDTNGALRQAEIRGGYVYWPVESSLERVMLLEASGHNLVYVNGELRMGDPYSYGYVRVPVLLHAGTNDFLFQGSRGAFRAKLIQPTGRVVVDPSDSTLPDAIIGQREPAWGAVVLQNATTNAMEASVRCPDYRTTPQTVSLPPLGIRKAPFTFVPGRLKAAADLPINLEVTYRGAEVNGSAHAVLKLRVRRPDQSYKQTFVSSIDDSVQYFAVNPPPAADLGIGEHERRGSEVSKNQPALFLSLHGAGVEAIGQAEAYAPKRWGILVCPTNRRPYGFDWEDWGRLDALEVLALAEIRFHPDPRRIYLTGHSMGGHGTWQLGALFPDHFAAIGPSAGWISFMSYAETNRLPATNSLQQLLRRAMAASDTLLLASNYSAEGIYILHGDADDNVPVTQAREMRRVLGQFHHDVEFHEQAGAGHWWDVSDEPGADCVDWAPMFDFFARHCIPQDQDLRQVRFSTVNPAISGRSHWITIASQEHSLALSSIEIRCDPGKRRFIGTTTNIARLRIGLSLLAPNAPVAVELDGQKLTNLSWPSEVISPSSAEPGLWLEKNSGSWRQGEAPGPSVKNPGRSGPFRQAFCRHMVFVYGTAGTAEENAWACSKARYDAEAFWYRGNGSVPIMSDRHYLHDLGGKSVREFPGTIEGKSRWPAGCNVILYGNSDCNAAWAVLLKESPIQVRRGEVTIGQRRLAGDDLACLFLRPNPYDALGLIGVVSGSGMPGMRLSERLPYFTSGVGYPDCFVVGADMLNAGIAGVRAVGFFGQDWGVESGEFGWRD